MFNQTLDNSSPRPKAMDHKKANIKLQGCKGHDSFWFLQDKCSLCDGPDRGLKYSCNGRDRDS